MVSDRFKGGRFSGRNGKKDEKLGTGNHRTGRGSERAGTKRALTVLDGQLTFMSDDPDTGEVPASEQP